MHNKVGVDTQNNEAIAPNLDQGKKESNTTGLEMKMVTSIVPDETESQTQSNFDTSSSAPRTHRHGSTLFGAAVWCANNCYDPANCAQPIESLVSNVMAIVGDTDLQNNTVDSRDLQKYKAKIPIFFIYVLSFVAAFTSFFYFSFTEDIATKYVSPKKSPKSPDSKNCESDLSSVTGIYKIDKNGVWEGSEGFDIYDVAYEVKFQNFKGSYDEWSTITDDFRSDLQRVKETSQNMRNNQGNFAYDLLVPSAYSFTKQTQNGFVQFYFKANAAYLFNNYYQYGSMTGYQKNNTEIPCFSNDDPCAASATLTSVAPGEIETTYQATDGKLTFTIPTFETSVKTDLPEFDDYTLYDHIYDDAAIPVTDNYKARVPSSNFITNMMYHIEGGKYLKVLKTGTGEYTAANLKLKYDMRSVSTALAINNGLASFDSLKPMGPVDLSKIEINEEMSLFTDNFATFIDPYYPDMDPITCVSASFLDDFFEFSFELFYVKYKGYYKDFTDDVIADAFRKMYNAKELEALRKEIEANDQRRLCFISTKIEFYEVLDEALDPRASRFPRFLAFPTISELGSWSGKKHEDSDPVSVKEECWFPAYERYDGLKYDGDWNSRFVDSPASFWSKELIISFYHIRAAKSEQLFLIQSFAKLMHVFFEYPTVEERFNSLYTESAATTALTKFLNDLMNSFFNEGEAIKPEFYDLLYDVWRNENQISDQDPLSIAYGSYGLRDGWPAVYNSVEDIGAREDLCLSRGPNVGFLDFISNNSNVVLDIEGGKIVGRGNSTLSGCPSTYSDIMTNMFEKYAPKEQNSFSFTTSVIMDIAEGVSPDGKSVAQFSKIRDIVFDKALKGIAEPPVQLSTSFETCGPSLNKVFVDTLGTSFANAKLISDVVLMLLLFFTVFYLNKFVIKSKEHKLISPENKNKLFRMTTSLAIQRLLKLDPKDYSKDKELKDIVHVLHLYDDMQDEEENFDHIRDTLNELGIEVDSSLGARNNTSDPELSQKPKEEGGLETDFSTTGNDYNSKTGHQPGMAFSANDNQKIAQLEAALKSQKAAFNNLVERVSQIEKSKDM